MRNKNDGGYSLALVLVVMAVLATIAVTLTTVVLRNIDNQSKYTQKMQAQYEAQGKLEKVLAELSQNQVVEMQHPMLVVKSEDALKTGITTICETASVTPEFASDANSLKLWRDKDLKVPADLTAFDTFFTYDFKLIAYGGENKLTGKAEASVTYDIQLKGSIASSFSPQKTGQNTSDNMHLYVITLPEITLKSVSMGGVE